ncbi:MAG TPA: hypothetical protein VN031_02725 [Candidatus Microsaccharimonas sp.]|nr:hypothetical protein [Candidatus Microsaccharimonas sp.]
MMALIIEADATTDAYKLYENPEMRLQDEPTDRTEIIGLPADPKTRLTLGQHEDERIRHGMHFDRKMCEKSALRHVKRSKRKLSEALQRRLFSDNPGDLNVYRAFDLTKREKAQVKLHRKETRRSRILLPELQPA